MLLLRYTSATKNKGDRFSFCGRVRAYIICIHKHRVVSALLYIIITRSSINGGKNGLCRGCRRANHRRWDDDDDGVYAHAIGRVCTSINRTSRLQRRSQGAHASTLSVECYLGSRGAANKVPRDFSRVQYKHLPHVYATHILVRRQLARSLFFSTARWNRCYVDEFAYSSTCVPSLRDIFGVKIKNYIILVYIYTVRVD